ncbi:HAD family hydrolase [Ensifer sp. P24N7]|uniref:HAD family hydrolase n=1 Tax=Sinorhizobium sp. P24N7 TaxID=3348358 RepID=UPI0035F42585
MALTFAGVVLDLDGLLLDTERLQAQTGPEVLREFGYAVEQGFFHRLVGLDHDEATRLINHELGAYLDSVALEEAWNGIIDRHMQDEMPLRPGVHRFFDALDAHGLPRSIATNSVTAKAEWKLRRAGLFDRVNAVVGVDQVSRGKPAPHVYIEGAHRLGLSPELCVALDDSDLGVRSAIAAGISTVIQVPDMTPSRERLAHHQVDSLDDALCLLGLGDKPGDSATGRHGK